VVKFGVHVGPQQCTIDELRQVWLRSEELGFDWISTWDHFYAATFPPEGPCFEALTTHAALATLTSRPRVGSLVYCAAFRHPALLANAAVTIDHLSGGRLELGIGAGWQPEEHLAYGFPYDPPAVRLRRLAETVEIVRLLWTEESVDYAGEFFTLKDARCDPKPVQSPPRIWVGAAGEKVGLKLAGRLGDGWNLVFPSPEEFARKLAVVKEASPHPDRLAAGVNIGLVDCEGDDVDAALRRRFGDAADVVKPATLAGSPDQMADHVTRYVEAGAEWIVLALRAPFELEALERFATQVMPRFRADEQPSTATGAVFGSHEWFGHLAAILTEEVAAAPELVGDTSLCFQEVFEGTPFNGGQVAWHVRFGDGGIVSLGYGAPVGDADVEQIVDWAGARPLARMLSADPALAEQGKLLFESGGVKIVGDFGAKTAVAELFHRLHDRLALRTR
jgi:alkanesulfonate monooxygenase SsuD/methylene tetrahydromethanopterin reductase-like flavin-dependent oxidoreductase (luciferase family)